MNYFSVLYYLLLSEIEAFDMIHILASAIKEINEYKMKLYYQEIYSLQDFIHVLKKIESLLILRVAAYVNEPELNPIIEDWLITGKLIQEKRNIQNKDRSEEHTSELQSRSQLVYCLLLQKQKNILLKDQR